MRDNKKKILVIEDNREFAEGLSDALKSAGFLVMQADNLQLAEKILSGGVIDGVSLDLQLHGELGVNLLKKIKSNELSLDYQPFIITVSSFISPNVMRVLKQHQVLHYDKSSAGFDFEVVSESFASILNADEIFKDENVESSKSDNEISSTQLRSIIRNILDSYNLNARSLSYERLVEGIYYMLVPSYGKKLTLVNIFVDILDLDYHTAFVGMARLIKEAVGNEENVQTPGEFMHQIMLEIQEKHPELQNNMS